MNKTQTVTPATSTSGAVTAVIVVYTVSRLALLLAADAISSLHTNLPIPRVLAPWDGTYYIGILKSGYPIHVNPASVNSEPIAFFRCRDELKSNVYKNLNLDLTSFGSRLTREFLL